MLENLLKIDGNRGGTELSKFKKKTFFSTSNKILLPPKKDDIYPSKIIIPLDKLNLKKLFFSQLTGGVSIYLGVS